MDNYFINKRRAFKSKLLQTQSHFDLGSSAVIAPRDPKRLLKPTRQWIARMAANEEVAKFTATTTSINHIPKL